MNVQESHPVGMFLTIISIALITVTTSLASYAKQPPIQSATPVVVLLPFVFDNPDFFDLTPGQKKKIAIIAQHSSNQRIGLDQLVLDMRAELRKEMIAYHADQKEIKKLQNELLKQEKARLQLSIDCANNLRKVLTGAQWKTLLELAIP